MLIVSEWDQFSYSILNDINIVKIVHVFLRPELSSYISATFNATFTKLSGQIEMIMTFNYVHGKLPSGKITRSFFTYPLLLPATRSFYPLPAPNRYSLARQSGRTGKTCNIQESWIGSKITSSFPTKLLSYKFYLTSLTSWWVGNMTNKLLTIKAHFLINFFKKIYVDVFINTFCTTSIR